MGQRRDLLDHEPGIIVLNTSAMSGQPVAQSPMEECTGFTLIELLIVVAIIGILTTLGIPSYRAWVQNTQIYNATESALGGLQMAKGEAVKRNASVQFVLVANATWLVQLPASAVIQTSTTEGAKNVVATATPTSATTITFSNLGGIVTNADGSATLTQIDFNSNLLPTTSRHLRITIGINGVGTDVRMCDPNLATGSNPRAC